jgi:hypothetical protein
MNPRITLKQWHYLVICLVSLALMGQVQNPSSLAFLDDRPLNLEWDIAPGKSIEPTQVSVCNVGAEGLSGLEASLTGFGFKSGEEPADDNQILSLPQRRSSLGAGECWEIPIQTLGTSKPEPGSYTGILSVYGPRAGLAQRVIAITVKNSAIPTPTPTPTPTQTPTPTPTAVTLASVSSPVSRDASRYSTKDTFVYRVYERVATVPYFQQMSELIKALTWRPVEDYEYIVQLNTLLPDRSTLLPTPGTELGVLVNKESYAKVFAGETKGQTEQLPIRIEGLRKVGTYTGKIYLSGKADGGSEVELLILIHHAWYWAVVAILSGILVAFLSQYFQETWRISQKLKKRREASAENYPKASAQFRTLDNELKYQFPSDPSNPKNNMNEELSDFDRLLKKYRKNNLFFKTDSDDFKKILKKLETIEQDINCIYSADPPSSPLKESSSKLDAILIEKGSTISGFYPGKIPLFKPQAEKLLPRTDKDTPIQLPVGGALKLRDDIDKTSEFIRIWANLAVDTKAYLEMADQIRVDPTHEKDNDKLLWVKAKLNEVRFELVQTLDETDLDKFNATKDLKEAYKTLAFLKGKYGVQPPSRENEDEIRIKDSAIEFAALEMKLRSVISIEPYFSLPLDKIDLSEAFRSLGDIGVVVVAVAAAVVTGLQTSYIDKPFGTWMDYAVLILVGAAAQTTVTGLKTLITNLRAPIKS